MATRLPKTLYHYCSVPTFYNIIKNKSIWLSDISKSNDSQELRGVKDRFWRFSFQQWEKHAQARQRIGLSDDYNVFKQFEAIMQLMLKTETYKYCVFCLSEKKDDIGQWRGYADDGRGISIGFPTKPFAALDRLAAEGDDSFSFCFRKVSYGEKAIQEYFDLILDNIDLNLEDTSNHVMNALSSVVPLTLDVAPWFKNEGFRQEKEWRLIYKKLSQEILTGEKPEMPKSFQAFSNDLYLGKYGYIPRGNELVSHVEFGINNFENMISEIIIGPKCNISKDEIYLFLISCGVIESKGKCAIKVSKSTSTYR